MEKLEFKIHLQTKKAVKCAWGKAFYSPWIFQDTHTKWDTTWHTPAVCSWWPFLREFPVLSKGTHPHISTVFLAGSCCPEMEMFSCLENRGLLCLQGKADPAFHRCSWQKERQHLHNTCHSAHLGPALELLLDALSPHGSIAFCLFLTCFANTAEHPALCPEAVPRFLH